MTEQPPQNGATPANRATREGKELSDTVAVVTGSSRGIGKAIAMELAAAGSSIVVHAGRDRSAAETVAEEISSLGVDVTAVRYDVSDPAACEQFIDHAFGWKNGVDFWINNAGFDVLTGAAANYAFESKMARLWKVDVSGTIRLGRAAGGLMKSNGAGVILNMGWDQAFAGQAGDGGEMFAAMKGAIMAFSLSLAKSLAPEVRVNCLAPGWIKTAWGESTSPFWDSRARGESLVGRWGMPEDVAKVARFLCSPAASFVNGQIIPINGGSQPWPKQLTDRNTDATDKSGEAKDESRA